MSADCGLMLNMFSFPLYLLLPLTQAETHQTNKWRILYFLLELPKLMKIGTIVVVAKLISMMYHEKI